MKALNNEFILEISKIKTVSFYIDNIGDEKDPNYKVSIDIIENHHLVFRQSTFVDTGAVNVKEIILAVLNYLNQSLFTQLCNKNDHLIKYLKNEIKILNKLMTSSKIHKNKYVNINVY